MPEGQLIQWEYVCREYVGGQLMYPLFDYGVKGWELCGIDTVSHLAYFKRPKIVNGRLVQAEPGEPV